MSNPESEKHEDRVFYLLTDKNAPMTAREISIALGHPIQNVSSICSRLTKKETIYAFKGVGVGKSGRHRVLTMYTASRPPADAIAVAAAAESLASHSRSRPQKNTTPTIQDRIGVLMGDGAVRTTREIIDALGEKRGSVSSAISAMVRDGRLSMVDDEIRARLGVPGYVGTRLADGGKRQTLWLQIMEIMSDRVPRTSKEIQASLKRHTKINSITPRVSELVALGYLKRAGISAREHTYVYARQYFGESLAGSPGANDSAAPMTSPRTHNRGIFGRMARGVKSFFRHFWGSAQV